MNLSDACGSDPGVAGELAVRLLRGDERLRGDPMFTVLTPLVPTGQLPALVDAALRHLESGGDDDAASGLLDVLSFQSPEAFHPVLDRLFEQVVRSSSRRPSHTECNNATRAWHRSGLTHLEALRAQLGRGIRRRRLAWHALFRTREPEAIECARSHPSGFEEIHLRQRLSDVNLGPDLRSLYCDDPLFIQFPPGLLSPDHTASLSPTPSFFEYVYHRHPTWNIPDVLPQEYALGGKVAGECGSCAGPLHRMIFLDPVPASLAQITSVPKLDVVTCLSCIGWKESPLFFVHDSAGTSPEPWTRRTRPAVPTYPTAPVVEAKVRLGRAGPRWRDLSHGVLNVSRVGDSPTWEQNANYPACPGCASVMYFIAQFASAYPTADGGFAVFGDGGILYAFWCDRCRISANHWQGT